MVKKVDKGQLRDKTSPNQDTLEETAIKSSEPYICNGRFQTDFTELCRRIDFAVIPPIVLRAKPPPVTHHHVHESKHTKGKQAVHTEPEPDPEFDEDGEPIDMPPKTYTVRCALEYFKPTIDVEMDNPDKQDTVTEVYIRGWRIDDSMMNIFKQCWPVVEKLHTINLWHVGLSGDTLIILAGFLPLCLNIKNIILDGNWVKEENWYELIEGKSLVQNLSLKNCCITDKGAKCIGQTLAKKACTKLLSLNLNGNRITDSGCEDIAMGLRMNRTLLTLSLACNQIGDKGCSKLAEVLSRFPLTHEEVVQRRLLISEKDALTRHISSVSIQTRHGKHGDKSKKDKAAGKQKKEHKNKDGQETGTRKDEKSTKKDSRAAKETTLGSSLAKPTKIPKSSSAISVIDPGKASGKAKDKKRDKKVSSQDYEMPESLKNQSNPLLEEMVDCIDGDLWVAGNRVLIRLNLSRNHITIDGVHALLKGMEYQTTRIFESKICGTGLMRLDIHKNDVPPDHDLVKELEKVMIPRDPFYKPPINPDGDMPDCVVVVTSSNIKVASESK